MSSYIDKFSKNELVIEARSKALRSINFIEFNLSIISIFRNISHFFCKPVNILQKYLLISDLTNTSRF